MGGSFQFLYCSLYLTMLNKRVNLGSGMEKGMRNTGKRALHRLGILALE